MDFYNWQSQMRRGILDMVVMNLLGGGEYHGYEMVQRLRRLKGLELREGNIYPVLARLQIDGLVRTYTLASTEGPPRKYYKLTKAGEQVLRRMNEHWDVLIDSLAEIRSGGKKQWTSKTGSGGS
jgi:PadR family transcriptional regulator PadR